MTYWGMKLRSGSTIFAELIELDESAQGAYYIIQDPLVYEQRETRDGIGVSLLPYVPYTKDTKCKISADEIFLANQLSPEFVSYYGRALMQIQLASIKEKFQNLLSGEIAEDYYVILMMLEALKDEAQKFEERFDIDSPTFGEMEELLEKHRPLLN